MKTIFFLAAAVASMLFAGYQLRAEGPDSNTKCPVSGQPVKADKFVEYNGGKVYFCCGNCPKAFEANTAKYAAKANMQLVETGQLVQVACPLSGRPTNPSATVEVGGVKVGLCCNNCKAKIEKASGDEQVNLLFANTSKGFKPAGK